MFYCFDEDSIIKTFATACFAIMLVFSVVVLILEILGIDAMWIGYRTFEFAVYGVFALGLYKIIKLLNQLIGEMKFFRHHYILKDTETAKVLQNKEK